MKRLNKIKELTVSYRGRTVGCLTTSADGRTMAFEYDSSWMSHGFSISPIELPLKAGVFMSRPEPFNGNFGVFEDSMPDGYGRWLLHKTFLREGVDDRDLGVIDRLSLVGNGGMGGLCYQPEIETPSEERITDMDLLQQKALEVLREKQDSDASLLLFNSGNSGGARPKAIYADKDGHWLVKFRHTYDPEDIGRKEYRVNELARAAGIEVADFRMVQDRYFASRRFDLDHNGNRLHVVTAGGLLGVSLDSGLLDYTSLLQLTGFLTQDPAQVEEMFRRMVFNYMIDNRDDHCKNFSFLVVDDAGSYKWRLSPAYDLTSAEPGFNGEHATSVNWKAHPDRSDFIEAGTRIHLRKERCEDIIKEVADALRSGG